MNGLMALAQLLAGVGSGMQRKRELQEERRRYGAEQARTAGLDKQRADEIAYQHGRDTRSDEEHNLEYFRQQNERYMPSDATGLGEFQREYGLAPTDPVERSVYNQWRGNKLKHAETDADRQDAEFRVLARQQAESAATSAAMRAMMGEGSPAPPAATMPAGGAPQMPAGGAPQIPMPPVGVAKPDWFVPGVGTTREIPPAPPVATQAAAPAPPAPGQGFTREAAMRYIASNPNMPPAATEALMKWMDQASEDRLRSAQVERYGAASEAERAKARTQPVRVGEQTYDVMTDDLPFALGHVNRGMSDLIPVDVPGKPGTRMMVPREQSAQAIAAILREAANQSGPVGQAQAGYYRAGSAERIAGARHQLTGSALDQAKIPTEGARRTNLLAGAKSHLAGAGAAEARRISTLLDSGINPFTPPQGAPAPGMRLDEQGAFGQPDGRTMPASPRALRKAQGAVEPTVAPDKFGMVRTREGDMGAPAKVRTRDGKTVTLTFPDGTPARPKIGRGDADVMAYARAVGLDPVSVVRTTGADRAREDASTISAVSRIYAQAGSDQGTAAAAMALNLAGRTKGQIHDALLAKGAIPGKDVRAVVEDLYAKDHILRRTSLQRVRKWYAEAAAAGQEVPQIEAYVLQQIGAWREQLRANPTELKTWSEKRSK